MEIPARIVENASLKVEFFAINNKVTPIINQIAASHQGKVASLACNRCRLLCCSDMSLTAGIESSKAMMSSCPIYPMIFFKL
jgi:hypothetical protein